MQILTGNIFTSRMQTLVNTVNCAGVMGAGVALEYRLRYPAMFARYAELCAAGQLAIGKLWLYRSEERDGGRWILNFPTKQHWKLDSRPEYLEQGLQKFCQTYRDQGITSVAFPLLGASHGGLAPEVSLEIMRRHLADCEIPVEIWHYEADAADDLYDGVTALFARHDNAQLAPLTGMRPRQIEQVREALARDVLRSLIRLREVPGLGEKTLAQLFRCAMQRAAQATTAEPAPAPATSPAPAATPYTPDLFDLD